MQSPAGIHPAATLMPWIASADWSLRPGRVPEGTDDGSADEAAKALAALTDERQDGVAAALGAGARPPLAVVDGVGLHREHQSVRAAETDAVDEESDKGQRQTAAAGGDDGNQHETDDGDEARAT